MVKKQTWKDKLAAKLPKLTWWQIILIILAAGIVFSGFDIKSKWLSCNKKPLKIKKEVK